MSKVLRILDKNSPTILTGLAVGGVITTTVLAVRATPKAILLIEGKEDRQCESLPPKEIIQTTWKVYLPVVISGVVTIVCIVAANSINLKRNTAIAGAAAITEVALKEYQAKVVETLGETKDRKIRDEIAKDRITNDPPMDSEVIIIGNGDVLCYDSWSGRYFQGEIEKIRRAVNDMNKELLTGERISVNDLYYAMGLDPNKNGDEIGWDNQFGLIELDFSTQLTPDNKPCLVVNFKNTPTVCF